MALFILGWLSSGVYSGIVPATGNDPLVQKPASFSLTGLLTLDDAPEKYSPHDRIPEDKIHVFNDKVVMDLEQAEWAGFTDTNSMDPVIDEGSNAIQVVPTTPEEIHVGDIVSYRSPRVDGTVIHRVIRIGYDNEGWYAIMKGDNLASKDPDKVRFEQVERVLVAIIY